MAGISNSIVQGLMNPSWGQGMSQGISQGMTGIGGAIRNREKQQALDSMFAQAMQGDIFDPNVRESIYSTARQMRVDPSVANKVITQAEQQQYRKDANSRAERGEARAERSVELREDAAVRAEQRDSMISRMRELQLEEAQKAKQGENFKNAARKVMEVQPDKVDQFIKSVPLEYQDGLENYVSQLEANRLQRQENMAKIKDNEAIPQSDLEAMEGKVPAAAIEQYKELTKGGTRNAGWRTAKARLYNLYDRALRAETDAMNTQTRPSAGTVSMIEGMYEELSDDIVLQQNSLFVNDIELSDRASLIPALAEQAAQKMVDTRDSDEPWQPTPENLVELAKQYEIPKEGDKEESTPKLGGLNIPKDAQPGDQWEDEDYYYRMTEDRKIQRAPKG